MRRSRVLLFVFSAIGATLLCRFCFLLSAYVGPLSKPVESHVDLDDPILNEFNADERAALLRHFSQSRRWEVHTKQGLTYAVRLELVDNQYASTLNGFYYSSEGYGPASLIRVTRVIVSFGKPHGFGPIYWRVTTAGISRDVPLIIAGPHDGFPGNTSRLILKGNGMNLEIYDQAPELERAFTKQAYAEVCAELREFKKSVSEGRSSNF